MTRVTHNSINVFLVYVICLTKQLFLREQKSFDSLLLTNKSNHHIQNYKITFDGYDAEHDLLSILKFNIHLFDLSFEVFKIIKVILVHLKITGCGLPIMNSKIMTKGDAGIFI